MGGLPISLWDTINNKKKVSINLLADGEVKDYSVEGDTILVIRVPMANRHDKPVYINDNLFGGTFRRNWESDYRCTRIEVKAMLRGQVEFSSDMETLGDVPMADLNYETIKAYRNRHKLLHPDHAFEQLSDDEYLRSIGASAISKIDKQRHPTVADMLMFGVEYNIVRHFPDYFLDN